MIYKHVKNLLAPVNEDNVLDFDSEEALLSRADSKPQFVKFYQTWCSHCKNTKKAFLKAASLYKDRVDFVDVDCGEHTEFCQSQGVTGYPVLKYFDNSGNVRFDEAVRDAIMFEKYLDGKLSEANTTEEPDAAAGSGHDEL